MKKPLVTFLLCFTLASAGHAQKLAVKMNGLGLATFAGFGQWSPTPNLGAEVALWPRWTIDIDGYINPFTFSDNKSTQFWAVQPELRFWFCNKFNGHFIGLHGQYADYQDFGTRTYIYDGHLAGLGLSYGYVLPLAYRWKLEFNLGAGWNSVNHDSKWLRGNPEKPDQPYLGYPDYYGKFFVNKDNQPAGNVPCNIHKDYWGITRAGVSIIFLIR